MSQGSASVDGLSRRRSSDVDISNRVESHQAIAEQQWSRSRSTSFYSAQSYDAVSDGGAQGEQNQ